MILQVMEDYVRNEAATMYDDIPRDCFNAKLPKTVLPYPDNAVIPYHFSVETVTGGFTKWIRASKFQQFIGACKQYGLTSAAPVLPESLQVVVMAYMPLRDAYELHALIQNSDELSGNFAHAVEKSEAVLQVVQPQIAPEDVDMVGSDEKVGYLPPDSDINISVGFTVTNYSVLWAKADKYCMMTFLADPVSHFINNIESCNKVFANRPLPNLESMQAAFDEAKRMLVFSMYHKDNEDSHDVLLQMFPETHNAVFLDCIYCNPVPESPPHGAIAYSDDTIQRLNQALDDMGYPHYYPPPSVESSQYNLMIAKGRLEYGQLYEKALLAFNHARQEFMGALNPVLHDLTYATEKLTLMGAASIDDELGEDDFLELN